MGVLEVHPEKGRGVVVRPRVEESQRGVGRPDRGALPDEPVGLQLREGHVVRVEAGAQAARLAEDVVADHRPAHQPCDRSTLASVGTVSGTTEKFQSMPISSG